MPNTTASLEALRICCRNKQPCRQAGEANYELNRELAVM